MSEAEAAWVRACAWTRSMRKTYRDVPGFYRRCACQGGLTQWCGPLGRHERCHRATPQPVYATLICRGGGDTPAHFAQPYAHETPSITKASREFLAQVWLADRICRWVCPCDCHGADAPGQIGLFEVAS